MSELGNDIKDVYREVGIRALLFSGETFFEEFAQIKKTAFTVKPFVREFQSEAYFPYDTSGECGMVVEFPKIREQHLIMHRTAEVVEGEVYRNAFSLYKCNVVSGELWYSSGEDWDAGYQKVPQWFPRKTGCKGVVTEPMFYGDLTPRTDIGDITANIHELYIPKAYGAKPKDRFYTSPSGEYFEVQVIQANRFPGCDVALLIDDVRE